MGTIESIVVSWSLARAQPSRFTRGAGSPDLSNEASYRSAWTDASAGGGDWRPPWASDRAYSNFWKWEVGGSYESVSPHGAWQHQVPLRREPTIVLESTVAGAELGCAQFLYPTGTGVMVTAVITGDHTAPLLLASLAELTANVRVQGGARSMNGVLDMLLDDAEVNCLGQPDPSGSEEKRARTVAVVTKAKDWDSPTPQAGDEVHRLLASLCLMSAAPLTGTLAPLESMVVGPPTTRFADTVRVALGSGQAIWSLYQPAEKLACYEHNLALASMQTSVLLETVRWLSDSAPLEALRAESVRLALQTLGRKYGAADSVYSSDFVRRQIDDSHLVDQINRLRAEGPLHAR
ncbi:hypothetical protein GA0111570_11442 [Raineyella antarctica]|uniref:Uncharacterized protein n=1 Tax=Raineyella antarctica TaxID=1577474 RepID=A0A1G6I5U5_9ACTN|nr:hypothetical protein [Raineyella antarctica]SDC01743.1 hypothetical protein GA0111570_11442 [Raineyella antarctica]